MISWTEDRLESSQWPLGTFSGPKVIHEIDDYQLPATNILTFDPQRFPKQNVL